MLRRTFLAACGAIPLVGDPLPGAIGPTPAAPNSSAYCLTASPEGEVYLVWIDTEGERHDLRLSRLEGNSWTPATTIASGGADWFVNWADHPMVSAGPGGRLLASYSYRPSAAKGSKWGLATRVLFSPDRGRTWKKVSDLGADNTADYTGFFGFWSGDEGFRAAYLSPLGDGAHQHDEGHVKTLRFAEISLDGRLLDDELVDADVCTCCPLSMTVSSGGPVIAYRDHEAGEIRDISIVRRVDGKWTEPMPVHRDGWEINGCPVNGASIQSAGERVAAAWFTAAGGESRVLLALSDDSGASFGSPIQVDNGSPVGRASLALLDDGRPAVSWIEKREGDSGVGDLMLRFFDRDGNPAQTRRIAASSSGRAMGVPQLTRSGNRLVMAWRQDEQVRTTVVDAG